jgi:hypothetical protein
MFTGMYECFSIVFFNSAGSDVLEKETTTFSPCDFFLWGFVKDSVYVPPLLMTLEELRDRIMHAPQTTTADMLHRVWDELDYRVDVCCVTQGAYIEEL